MVISLGLVSYLSISKAYKRQTDFLNEVSNNLHVVEIIKNALDHAGFDSYQNENSNDDKKLIYGISHTDSKKIHALGLDKKGNGEIIKKSDALVIFSASQSYQTDKTYQKNQNVIELPSSWSLKSGDQLLISSYFSQFVVTVKDIKRKYQSLMDVILDENLKQNILKNSFINLISQSTFYVGKTKKKDSNGNITNAFFVKYNHRRYELISKIDQLSIKYFIEDGAQKSNKNNASQVKDWSQLKGVEVILSDQNHQKLTQIIAVKRNLG